MYRLSGQSKQKQNLPTMLNATQKQQAESTSGLMKHSVTITTTEGPHREQNCHRKYHRILAQSSKGHHRISPFQIRMVPPSFLLLVKRRPGNRNQRSHWTHATTSKRTRTKTLHNSGGADLQQKHPQWYPTLEKHSWRGVHTLKDDVKTTINTSQKRSTKESATPVNGAKKPVNTTTCTSHASTMQGNTQDGEIPSPDPEMEILETTTTTTTKIV